MAARMRTTALALLGTLALGRLGAAPAVAADWQPAAWTDEDTVELRTVGPTEGEHWFPVWLVVLDDQLYVRLGTRAAERVQQSTTAPHLDVRIAGREFQRVKGAPAPDMADRVAAAMGEKYWSDLLIRYLDHPLTLRLAPDAEQ
jgi:hypothetical protein